MIKVLHFIYGLSIGGAETLLKEYALGLDKNKFDLTILCLMRYGTPYEKILQDGGIKVIYLCDNMPLVGKKDIFSKAVNCVMRYILSRKYIKNIKPDILHYHLSLASYVRFMKLGKKVPIVYTQHFDVKRWSENYAKDIRDAKWIIKNYKTQMIALNEDMKAEIDTLFGISNTVVLNNGISFKKFQNAKSGKIVRAELGIPQDSFVMGHVGRFNPIKNHEFLVDVFYEVYKKNKKAFLLLIGEGELKEKIRNRLKELNIDKNSLILSNRSDVADLMQAMDCAIFPSFSEGLLIGCIEAQIAGKRCIVSDVVPRATEISNLIQYKKLDEGAVSWAQAVLEENVLEAEYFNAEQWDMKNVIRQLAELYENLVEDQIK